VSVPSRADDLCVAASRRLSVDQKVDALAEQIESRVRTLRSGATDEIRKHMTAEARELSARKLLAKHDQTVLDDIERKKVRCLRSLHRGDQDKVDHAKDYRCDQNGRFRNARRLQPNVIKLLWSFTHRWRGQLARQSPLPKNSAVP
jgi:hypothetical protein